MKAFFIQVCTKGISSSCAFCFLFAFSQALASEIRISFENTSGIKTAIELRKDDVVLDSAIAVVKSGDLIVLNSQYSGIHGLSFDRTKSVNIYFKEGVDLELFVDLEKGKFEVRNSPESQQMDRLFHVWEKEFSRLNTLIERDFEVYDSAFDNLTSEILATQNPEIIDWASVFLIDLEKDPSNYILSLEKFIDFEQIVKEKYPSYKFNKLKVNFAIRKDNQSGYYWKY